MHKANANQQQKIRQNRWKGRFVADTNDLAPLAFFKIVMAVRKALSTFSIEIS